VSHLLPDEIVVAAYRELRERVIDLLRSITDEESRLMVPACPAWNVLELASHLVGVPEDILAGRMEGVTTEAWTQVQVDRHRGASAAELADRLEATIDEFDVVLPHIPSPTNSQMVMDAVTHEFDLRGAIGRPGARDSSAVKVGLGWLLDRAEAKNPRFIAGIRDSVASDYDLLRSLTGRRTIAQIAATGLDAEVVAELLAGSPLRAPADPVDS
jgi:uncharacterized protein (TIGR03083 family)